MKHRDGLLDAARKNSSGRSVESKRYAWRPSAGSSLRFGWSAAAVLGFALACSASGSGASNAGGSSGTGQGGSAGSGGNGAAGSGGASATGGGAGTINLGGVAGSIAGTGGGDSGLPLPDGGCAYAAVESTLLPANILVVLDRSGSMNCNLPPITESADCEATPVQVDTTQPRKWDVVVGGLKDAFVALPPSASVGLAFFNNNDVCGVNSTPSVGVNLLDTTQIAALSNALDSVPPPKGGTPIVGAAIVAYKHLHEQAQVVGNKFVVLITDGKETCDPDKVQILQTEIPKAVSVNIRTFVIGAPGSEPARALLSEMAYLGGTARSATCDHSGSALDQGDCHFDMTTTQNFAADLAAGLAAISGQALGCELDVPAADPSGHPVDYAKVNVRYARAGDANDIVDILQDPARPCDGGAEGWQYAQDNKKIVLCGSVCDDVKADEKARVEVVLGCETAVVK